jgi:UDP-MurNAc hydroxylase
VRLTTLGHGALFIEGDGTTVLVDPWLSGSCYWRSWWHFPPTGDPPDAALSPDVVYLSHHHFDHFHYPSMRRIDRRAKVLMPQFGVDVMADEVRRLGFTDVRELRHGDVVELGGGLRAASFQYGFDDSAFLVSDGTTTIADLNDCKVRGRALKQVLEVFGPPTFLLKNHSWAQGYPNCYTAEDPVDLEVLDRADYAADFLATVAEARPAYAVPFASMVCFLHPETRHLNQHVITPPEIAEAFAERPVPGTELVMMGPGDSWTDTGGFELDPVDYYTDREKWLDEMAELAEVSIARSALDEQDRNLTWPAFREHFATFLAALPPGAGRLVPRPIVFHVASDDTPFWVIDFRRLAVYRAAAAPAERASIVRTPDGVLADAIANRIVHFVHISMRLEIELRPGGVNEDFLFWGLLTIWELGYLPLQKLPFGRLAGAAWRRRRELWESLAVKAFGRQPLAARLSANLMKDADSEAA